MHLLSRICLVNWYLVDAIDIEINGAAALIGPTGAGKSSIQDAIQTVIAGNNTNRLHLNASASGRSQRSVRDYCLGYTTDATEGGKPLREKCETIIALVFRDEETGEPLTVGLALEARENEEKESLLARFIAPGYAFSVKTFRKRDGKGDYMTPWAEISKFFKGSCEGYTENRTSAEKFTGDMLSLMRGAQQVPNTRHFLRAFSNALAFKPIFDPTLFVRNFILEPDPLNVDRVRSSIETWQNFVRDIDELEMKLRRLQRIEGRFQSWGRALVTGVNARWRMAAAEVRRLSYDYNLISATLRDASADLHAERRVLVDRRNLLIDMESQLQAKRALLQQNDSAARIRQVETDITLASQEKRTILDKWEDLQKALSLATKLAPLAPLAPASYREAMAAVAGAPRFVKTGQDPQDVMRGHIEELDAICEALLNLEGLDHGFEEKADHVAEEVRKIQSDIERLESGLSRIRVGSSPLSAETSRLIKDFEAHGIQSVPLCDVVEVADVSWQHAIEALLGRAREALIVDPAQLRQAHDLMQKKRNDYFGLTLVKTTKTGKSAIKLTQDSVANEVRTSNPHAAAFIASRIGAFRKAETENDLDKLDRGVMRNGKTTSGFSLGVQRELHDLILGRVSGAQSAAALEAEVHKKRQTLDEKKAELRLLRDGAKAVPLIRYTMQKADTTPGEIDHALSLIKSRQSSLRKDLDLVEKSVDSDLLGSIKELDDRRIELAREITEVLEPKVEALRQKVADAHAKLEVHHKSLREAMKAKAAAYGELQGEDVLKVLETDHGGSLRSAAELIQDFKSGYAGKSGQDMRSHLTSVLSSSKTEAEAAEAEARREQSAAIRELSEYCANWRIDSPLTDNSPTSYGFIWTKSERVKLETNELRAYRDHCVRAEAEMRQIMKEDLLTRLAEKFDKVEMRLQALNQQLDRHRFTGQTYSFERAVNLRYERIYALATEVANNPEHAQGILSGETNDAKGVLQAAMEELQALIEGQDDTEHLSDYREYFTYELYMTDSEGRRTSMSTRAVKGSGGEAQAPFYVAIAASLASAYYPGSRGFRPQGMGLALFDEAFNKLDIKNTQALMNFFRDLGLQLMIAAPEDKRATFTEVLPTIITVNKSEDGRSAYVDSEFPGEKARQELGRINPDHLTIEDFQAAE